MAPWHDCEPCHSQPDGAPSAANPPSGPLNLPANSRQVSPRGAPLACPLPNSARAAIIGPVRPPHAVLITIYWNLACPVRLPLPISPCVNASASPFGGFGLTAALYNHGKDALDRVLSRTKNGTSFNDNLVTEVGGSCSSLYRVGLMNFRCLDIHSSHGRSRKDALQGATQLDRRAALPEVPHHNQVRDGTRSIRSRDPST